MPTSDPPPRPGHDDPGQAPPRPDGAPGQVPLRPGRDDAGQVPLGPGRGDAGQVPLGPSRGDAEQVPLGSGGGDPGQVPLQPGGDAGQVPLQPGRDPGGVPLRPGRDPGGRVAYLPPRAARARKLILRSQLGRGWILASALFGLVILAAGALFLARAGHPGPPWVRVAAVSSLAAGTVTEVAGPSGQAVVVDRRDGLRAFLTSPGPCPVRAADDGFARPCTGQRWDTSGAPAGQGGGAGSAAPPLRRVPAVVADGALYVDPR